MHVFQLIKIKRAPDKSAQSPCITSRYSFPNMCGYSISDSGGKTHRDRSCNVILCDSIRNLLPSLIQVLALSGAGQPRSFWHQRSQPISTLSHTYTRLQRQVLKLEIEQFRKWSKRRKRWTCTEDEMILWLFKGKCSKKNVQGIEPSRLDDVT